MVPSYYDNGLMLPLNDLMARDSVDFTTFNCAEQWIFGADRQMLALPSEHPMTYFFVNKTLLKDAGYEVPYGSWTFDQVLGDYANNPRVATIEEMYDLLMSCYSRK